MLTGLFYLSYKNTFNCEIDARLKLAYDIGMLSSVQKHYQRNLQTTQNIESGLIYPSIKELELFVSYSKLPLTLRNYLEKSIGDKPFNVINLLKHNNLTNSN